MKLITDKITLMKSSISLFIIFSIVSKFIGLFRDILFSYLYGTSFISDAYFVSTSIPNLLYAFLGGAIGAGFIPVFSKTIEKDSISKGNLFVNNLILLFSIFSLFFTIILILFPYQFIDLLAPGFNQIQRSISANFLIITSLTLVFTTFVAISSNLIKFFNDFITPVASGIVSSIIQIIFLFLSLNFNNLTLLPFGYFVSISIQVIFFIPFYKNTKHKFFFNLKANFDQLIQFLIIILPTLLSVSIQDVTSLFIKSTSSFFEEGTLSIFHYSTRLNDLWFSFLVIPISIYIHPLLSKYFFSNDFFNYTRVISKSLKLIFSFLIPIVIFIFYFHDQITSLVFLYGNMEIQSINKISDLFFLLHFGLIPISLIQIIGISYFSKGKTHIPIFFSLINLVFFLLFNRIFIEVFNFGIDGLAVSTSFSSFLTSILFLIYFLIYNKTLIHSFFKITIYRLIPYIIFFFGISYSLKFIFNSLPFNPLLNFSFIVLAYLFGFILIFKWFYRLYNFRSLLTWNFLK